MDIVDINGCILHILDVESDWLTSQKDTQHNATLKMAAGGANAAARVRVYVGGLPADTSEAELQERFSRFVASGKCRLQSVELLPPKGLFALSADATHRGFAYLTLQGETAQETTEQLVKTYHKTKWRGSVLRVEPAKPDFLERLQLEWQEQAELKQIQSTARAEARGLIAAAEREMGELEINVGGVAFSGKKRTTFEYEDIDFETAFAPKPKAVVTRAPVMMSEQINGHHSVTDDEEAESSAEEEQEDDDADYWATSGDESEKAGDDDGVENNQAEPSAASDGEEHDNESIDSEFEDDNEAPTEDAIAVDDVEAFVQQMLEQEQEEEIQQSVSAVTPEKVMSPVKLIKATRDEAQVDEDGVEAYVQQVEREEANARRIAALEAKLKQKQEKQQSAVVKIDLSAKSNKKITFDDSGNEQEENEDDGGDQDHDADADGTDGGGAITNWLDSSDDEGDEKNGDYGELRDGSDDEDDDAKKRKKRNAFEFLGGDDDNEDAKAFAVRPEFLGERGKKLFELQKRFGGDQRFRMDARFIDDEENEYGGTDGLVPDDDDDQVLAVIAEGPVGELQEFQGEDGEDQAAANEREWMAEQDLALSVIAELFPDVDIENIKYKMRVKVKKDPIKEASWMGKMMRYDPRDVHSRHAYEISIEDQKISQQNGSNEDGDSDDEDAVKKANDAEIKKKKAREEKEVLIGGDRFFSTSSALGSLFTRVRKNSEDGIAGEAALDGVFGFSRGLDDDTATTGDAADKPEDGAAAQGAGGATFKLSSLFDFPVEEDKEKNSRLAAMGEKLFEEENDDEEEKPWHFTQSFFSDEREDVRMDTDNEDEDDDGGEDAEGNEDDEGEQDSKKKPKKKVLKKSLTEFLEFGKSFMCPQDGSTNQKSKEWTEKRKKLTLDYKRKRKDALRNKKKIQQRLAKQHQNKKQKTSR